MSGQHSQGGGSVLCNVCMPCELSQLRTRHSISAAEYCSACVRVGSAFRAVCIFKRAKGKNIVCMCPVTIVKSVCSSPSASDLNELLRSGRFRNTASDNKRTANPGSPRQQAQIFFFHLRSYSRKSLTHKSPTHLRT